MALTPLDDSLWHQLPTTFDHVGTSDPRFFDRYWFACYARDGSAALQLTMGAYRNMNVLDAGCVVVSDGRQYNLRHSRALAAGSVPTCGPIEVQPKEPLREFRLVVSPGEQAVHGEITWRSIVPPHEEEPHFRRRHGRVLEDYQRFDQIGVADGWLEIEGRRTPVDDWWACRDHSWGVRPRMGVPEPVTGPPRPLSDVGYVLAFLFFSTGSHAGHIQFSQRGDGTETYTTGRISRIADGHEVRVGGVELRVERPDGSRRFSHAELHVTLADGTRLSVACAPMGGAIAMSGLGYSGGFADGKGLGAWRGASHTEADVWDVSHPSRIGYPDGTVAEHYHRIQPVTVSMRGLGDSEPGTGSLTLMLSGSLPAFGLA